MGQNTAITARCLISGSWREGTGEEITRSNPYNDELVTSVRAASLAEADEAVAAARALR